jgi:hypothetical protein
MISMMLGDSWLKSLTSSVNAPLEGGVLERYSEVTCVIFDVKNLILTYTKDFPKRIYEIQVFRFRKKKPGCQIFVIHCFK